MARYTIRVELLGVRTDAEEYEDLHEQMRLRGMTRTVSNSDGKLLRLPPAEYNYDGTRYADVDAVKEGAMAAARTTGLKYRVLVTKADGGRVWENLEEA